LMDLLQAVYAEAAFRLTGLTWLSVLDLLLVTLTFFIALKLVQGSRAATLLRGVLVVGTLLFAATILLPLPTFGTLVRGILIVVLVAMPMIFQPELRRLLERVGRSVGLTRTVPKTGLEAVITPLVRSLENLAASRTGALMVIRGSDPLQEVIETGVPFGGRLTSELLQTIFQPTTPLHDGAVVISEDRVVAAGCVLPLTQRPLRVGRRLGMRHRAAVGLSEISDALVIAVSEETGDISVARRGQLRRALDSAALREQLLSVYVAPAPSSAPLSLGQLWDRVKQALVERRAAPDLRFRPADAGLLALSLFLALVTWWFVVGQVNPARQARVEGIPIRLENVPPGISLMTSPLPDVSVLIQTTETALPTVNRASFQAAVSLRGLEPGVHRVPVRVSSSIPHVRVVEVTPPALDIQLAAVATRTMPVTIDVTNLEDLSPVYEIVRDPMFFPDQVQVIGPEQLVEEVSQVRAAISPSELTPSMRELRPVQALDAAGRVVEGVRLEPDQVRVELMVRRRLNVRSVGVRPVLSGDPPTGYWVNSVRVMPASVILEGPPDSLAEIGSFVETLPVDVSQVAGDFSADVPLALPAGVQVTDDQGDAVQTVTVSIETTPSRGDFVISRPVELLGAAADSGVSVTPQTVDVLLSGPLPVLNQIRRDPNLVRVVIDSVNAAPGESVVVSPTVVAPSGVETQLIPPTMQVTRPATSNR
jgi:diadenylate cyclase